MTVKMLVDRPVDGQDYKVGELCDTNDYTEAGLVAAKLATTDLAGGVAHVFPVAQVQYTPVTATTNPVTGGIEMPAINLTPSGPVKANKQVAATVRDYGLVNNASGTYTMHMCRRAPADFDAIQVKITGAASGANTFKVSVAPSSAFNNGWQPLDATGAEQSFTPITWGTTDRKNPRNPGGGAATTTVSGTSGSNANFDLIEGDVASDILSLQSIASADVIGAAPIIMLRVYGINPPGVSPAESGSASANPMSAVIPGFYSGYWAADYTSATPPSAPIQGWIPSVEITFWLRGKVVNVIGFAGDSIEMGWVPGTAVPQFGGNVNGWTRRLVDKLTLVGNASTYMNLAHTGNKSRLFHERAMSAVLTGRLTHLFIKPWSVNETSDGLASVAPALRRTTAVVQVCIERGIVPIIIMPWVGQYPTAEIQFAIQLYVSSMALSGVRVLDARNAVGDNSIGIATTSGIKADYKIVNSGGSVIDGIHLNSAGHEAVANFALENRASFLL